MSDSKPRYDIIGDIHGHASELIQLLELLDYDRRRGHYSHPDRKVVFLGDFIDRGPQIREVLGIVRPMLDNEAAVSVMGNHEFNAIAYHTRNADKPQDFLRPHSQKNVKQHARTTQQVPPSELYEHIDWFRTLPLSLDLGGLRAMHACWDEGQINVIKEERAKRGGITDEFMADAMDSDNDLFDAIEDVAKGKEVKLPDGQTFFDKDGNERSEIRIKWYESPENGNLANYALPAVDAISNDLDLGNDAGLPEPYPPDAPPVFFGHYWLKDETPGRLASNVACLDYSVAKKGGKLCAYR